MSCCNCDQTRIVKDLNDYKQRLIKQGKFWSAFTVALCISIAKGN